jgi:hypothetical protein
MTKHNPKKYKYVKIKDIDKYFGMLKDDEEGVEDEDGRL